jgi:hypothetical protein
MSRFIELPNAVYEALRQAAQQDGSTPVGWINARLPEPLIIEEQRPQTMAELFATRLGRIHGQSTSASAGQAAAGEQPEKGEAGS